MLTSTTFLKQDKQKQALRWKNHMTIKCILCCLQNQVFTQRSLHLPASQMSLPTALGGLDDPILLQEEAEPVVLAPLETAKNRRRLTTRRKARTESLTIWSFQWAPHTAAILFHRQHVIRKSSCLHYFIMSTQTMLHCTCYASQCLPQWCSTQDKHYRESVEWSAH